MSLKGIGLAIVFLFFMGGGISHFTNTDFFVAIMPPYLGWHLELVYLSGVFEMLGAIGIVIPRLRQLAGNSLMVLVICVTPANVHMWMNPHLFPTIPEAFLTVRLLLQLLLLCLIWWSTRTPAAPNS